MARNALARAGRWSLAALLTPFRVVGILVLLVIGGLKGRTNIKRAQARYLGLAADLGIDHGQVLICKFDGGSMDSPALKLVVLRPGNWQEALSDVVRAVQAAGYHERWSKAPYASPPKDLDYSPPPGKGLPHVRCAVHAPGEVIRFTDISVPDGYTGFWFSLN
jgi:hypothetical protein